MSQTSLQSSFVQRYELDPDLSDTRAVYKCAKLWARAHVSESDSILHPHIQFSVVYCYCNSNHDVFNILRFYDAKSATILGNINTAHYPLFETLIFVSLVEVDDASSAKFITVYGSLSYAEYERTLENSYVIRLGDLHELRCASKSTDGMQAFLHDKALQFAAASRVPSANAEVTHILEYARAYLQECMEWQSCGLPDAHAKESYAAIDQVDTAVLNNEYYASGAWRMLLCAAGMQSAIESIANNNTASSWMIDALLEYESELMRRRMQHYFTSEAMRVNFILHRFPEIGKTLDRNNSATAVAAQYVCVPPGQPGFEHHTKAPTRPFPTSPPIAAYVFKTPLSTLLQQAVVTSEASRAGAWCARAVNGIVEVTHHEILPLLRGMVRQHEREAYGRLSELGANIAVLDVVGDVTNSLERKRFIAYRMQHEEQKRKRPMSAPQRRSYEKQLTELVERIKLQRHIMYKNLGYGNAERLFQHIALPLAREAIAMEQQRRRGFEVVARIGANIPQTPAALPESHNAVLALPQTYDELVVYAQRYWPKCMQRAVALSTGNEHLRHKPRLNVLKLLRDFGYSPEQRANLWRLFFVQTDEYGAQAQTNFEASEHYASFRSDLERSSGSGFGAMRCKVLADDAMCPLASQQHIGDIEDAGNLCASQCADAIKVELGEQADVSKALPNRHVHTPAMYFRSLVRATS